MLKSPYQITLDPGGSHELVLLAYGEDLATSPFPNREDQGDSLAFAEAASTLPVGRGAAKRRMVIGVRRNFPSHLAMAAAHLAADNAMPVEAKALTFAITDDGTTTHTTYTYPDAHLRTLSFVPLDKKPLHALVTYTLHVNAPTATAS